MRRATDGPRKLPQVIAEWRLLTRVGERPAITIGRRGFGLMYWDPRQSELSGYDRV
jgi:hypothetical protein